jgi:hypothetical protein
MRTKKRILGVFGFAALMLFGTLASLQALPSGNVGFDDIYYSDATYTTAVGEHYQECDSGDERWGVISQYVMRDTWGCQPPSTCGIYACWADSNGNVIYSTCQYEGPC